MGVPLPPFPPPPPPTLSLSSKTLTPSPLIFWLTVVYGVVLFIVAAFAFGWALHLFVRDWNFFSRLGKVANILFFVGLALLLLIALAGLIFTIVVGVNLTWK
jgi:hypothetical protein